MTSISLQPNYTIFHGDVEIRIAETTYNISHCFFHRQEWVQATDLRISLDRLNTFGDDVFGDDRVLKSYYYAIVDVAVGARCACNGHASECVDEPSADGTSQKVCR